MPAGSEYEPISSTGMFLFTHYPTVFAYLRHQLLPNYNILYDCTVRRWRFQVGGDQKKEPVSASELGAPVILVLYLAAIKLRSSPRTILSFILSRALGTTNTQLAFHLRYFKDI